MSNINTVTISLAEYERLTKRYEELEKMYKDNKLVLWGYSSMYSLPHRTTIINASEDLKIEIGKALNSYVDRINELEKELKLKKKRWNNIF
tara:strand:+ start:112 stop:384 length:273 start_codon:yes stop_codon:yes gene_type:complete